MNQGCGEIRI